MIVARWVIVLSGSVKPPHNTSINGNLFLIVEALKSFIVFKNPPDHTVLRKLIMQAWNNHEIDEIVNENIEIILKRINLPDFNLVTELATPLPAMTITRILGLPLADYEYLEGLSHQMIRSLDLYLTFRQIQNMEKATKAFIDYFEKHAELKSTKPDNSLLSRIIQLNKTSFKIPHHELIANCFFLFIAGEETTAGLIELGLYHLIANQKLDTSLRDHHLRASTADELLRYDSPAQIVVRIASEEFQLGTQTIRQGDPITVCLGAANRDPEKFAQPEELILTRSPNHHLAFGSGIHRCLGDWLAKREFELLTQKLAHTFRSSALVDQPVWKENLNMRSLQSLRISFQ